MRTIVGKDGRRINIECPAKNLSQENCRIGKNDKSQHQSRHSNVLASQTLRLRTLDVIMETDLS